MYTYKFTLKTSLQIISFHANQHHKQFFFIDLRQGQFDQIYLYLLK